MVIEHSPFQKCSPVPIGSLRTSDTVLGKIVKSLSQATRNQHRAVDNPLDDFIAKITGKSENKAA